MSELIVGLKNVLDTPRNLEYTKPAIVCELDLETRAGSPLGNDPLGLDPLGLDPSVNPR